MTRKQSVQLASLLATLYDVPAWTEDRIKLFANDIVDLDYDAAKESVEVYRRTRSQRPQPSDIRELVATEALELLGPEEAWGELHAAIQRCHEIPTDFPPAITEALRFSGRSWVDLRTVQFDEYKWLKRDFIAAYREVTEGWQTRHQVGQLALPTRDEATQLLTEMRQHGISTTSIVKRY